LGASGLRVAPIGFGCMSFAGFYGPSDSEAAVRLIHQAVEDGIDFLDTADMYGWGHNEELVGRALAGRRKGVVLATKFGQVRGEGGINTVNGRPDYVAAACEASLKRLGTEVIDLYFQHRVDPTVPIEETVGAMARLIEAGKVRALGLCEAKPATIRRAHAVYPIAAVQSEYSLLYRVEAEETLATTRGLGIAFIAYSPLGRGLLAGSVRSPSDFGAGDLRLRFPRFVGEHFSKNLVLFEKIAAIAREKSVAPGQLALAWLLAQGEDVIPIPGTKRRERLAENIAALEISLSAADRARISAALPAGAASGLRYPEPLMKAVYL
jgi:aryl-alcohol dehydrogenase-like predicted oxidoreductase